jgi:hypothetical protein
MSDRRFGGLVCIARVVDALAERGIVSPFPIRRLAGAAG